MNKLQRSYETDFYGWTVSNARLLREKQFTKIDVLNLIEEIETMGRSERRELIHRMTCLLTHLLKWLYQPAFRSSSWELTIKEQRRQCRKLISQNPSLKSHFPEILKDAYDDALFEASKETGINVETFPTACNHDLEQILNDEFYLIIDSTAASESSQK